MMKIEMRVLFILVMGSVSVLQLSADTGVSIVTDFPGGNALVQSIKGDQVNLAPDLMGGRKWFYWCVEARVKRPGTVTFSLPAGDIGNQGPAFSTDQGKNWSYMGRLVVKGSSFAYTFT